MEQLAPILVPLLIVAVIALAIGLGYLAHKAEQKRIAELQALAAELGLSFTRERDKSHDERYRFFPIFNQGHSRAAYNTMEGEVQISGRAFPIRMGDYTYKITTSNGKTTSTTTYNLSYVIIHVPLSNVPTLEIRREHVLDKIAGALGFDDIDFESEEFSRKFHVKSSDKRFAYDVIHPGMIEFLMSHVPPTIMVMRGCMCLHAGSRWKAPEFRSWVDWCRAFFELWPEHVKAERSA